MIRLIVFLLIAVILFFIFAYFSSDEIKRKRRQRSAAVALLVIICSAIIVSLVEVRQQYNVEEAMIEQQFEKREDGKFSIVLNDVQITLEYQTGYASNRNAPRIHIVADFPEQPKALSSLFCDEKEFERFKNNNYGGWYPTPEIKLENQHFIGKCFSETIIDKIRSLPEKTHQFQPLNARYLFLPRADLNQPHRIEFFTENLDITALKKQMNELLRYYRLYL